MSATPGGNYVQPPDPDPARPVDETGEPVGYDSDAMQGYQQPPLPLPLLRPTDTYDLDPFVPSGYAWDPPSTGASITGFSLSLAGLVSCVFMPLLTAPLAAAGIAVSATALLRCRRGLAGGRRWAMAGLVLGILGIAVILSLFVFFVSLAASGDRGP